MRNEPNLRIRDFMIEHPRLGLGHGNCGYFEVPCRTGGELCRLRVIACDGSVTGWEHVSVSLPDRCPTWEELCHIKHLWWREDETVLQYHPAASRYVNVHPYTLHLWRPLAGVEVPMPPLELV